MSKSSTDFEEGMLRVSCVNDELPSSSSNAPLVKLLPIVLPACCATSIPIEVLAPKLVEFAALYRPPLPQSLTPEFKHMRLVNICEPKV